MSDRRVITGSLIMILALVALGFLVLGEGSAEVSSSDEPEVQAPTDGGAVVARLRSEGGFAPFGLRIVDSTHYVEVRFLTDPGCSALVGSGDPWPTTRVECRGPEGLEGTVAGLGVDRTGASIVGVEFEVSRDCFASLDPGTPWPSGSPECGT